MPRKGVWCGDHITAIIVTGSRGSYPKIRTFRSEDLLDTAAWLLGNGRTLPTYDLFIELTGKKGEFVWHLPPKERSKQNA